MLSDQIRAASIIAQNVVSTLERMEGAALPEAARKAAVVGLISELVAVMPTPFDGVLTAACNRYLAILPDQGWAGPRVETVSMVDGSVTMRQG